MALATPLTAAQLAPVVAQFGGALTSEGVNKETCIAVATKLEELVEGATGVEANEKQLDARSPAKMIAKDDTLTVVDVWLQALAVLVTIAGRLRGGLFGLELRSSAWVSKELTTLVNKLVQPSPFPLPSELLDLIFDVVYNRPRRILSGLPVSSHRDLLSCSLVCSTWRLAAQRLLFVQLRLNTHERLLEFVNATQGSSTWQSNITTLEVGRHGDSTDHSTLLAEALRRLPNLKVLYLFDVVLEDTESIELEYLTKLAVVCSSRRVTTTASWTLPSAPSLQHLSIRDESCQDSDPQHLPTYLSLRSLQLSCSTPLARERRMLVYVIARAETLQYLSFDIHKMSQSDQDEILKGWIEALPRFTNLRCLRLGSYGAYLPFLDILTNLPKELLFLQLVGEEATVFRDNYQTWKSDSFRLAFMSAYEQGVLPDTLQIINVSESDGNRHSWYSPRPTITFDKALLKAAEDLGMSLELERLIKWDLGELSKMYNLGGSWLPD